MRFILCFSVLSFVTSLTTKPRPVSKLAVAQDDDIFPVHGEDDNIDLDLLPAPLNLSRESILFGMSPSTKKRNDFLTTWKTIKATLPDVVTGARAATTADDNPFGGMYNMIFVRIPVLLAAVVYSINLVENHPLIIDVGSGPFTVNPFLAVTLFYFILR
jgi:hypothetical protein